EATTPDPASEAEPASGANDAESRQVSASEAITPGAGETAHPATDKPSEQDTDASPEPAEAEAQADANDASEAEAPADAQAGDGARPSQEDAPTVATSTEEAAV